MTMWFGLTLFVFADCGFWFGGSCRGVFPVSGFRISGFPGFFGFEFWFGLVWCCWIPKALVTLFLVCG